MIDHSQKLISGENLTTDISMVGVGYTIRDCQLSQSKARTRIFEGVKGLTFEGCNLFNCILPEDAKHDDCLYNPSDNPDNSLQQDIVEPTPEEIALAEKKMTIEQQVIDIFRATIKTEISKVNIATATAESVKTAAISVSTATVKP